MIMQWGLDIIIIFFWGGGADNETKSSDSE
jgi:hypothetical protein